jgi:16S rRNA (cytosine1402-N4)-methyltransferase
MSDSIEVLSKDNTNQNSHIPVLLDPIISNFLTKNDNKSGENLTIFDGTLGGGSYSIELSKIPNTKVFACDLDVTAIERVNLRIKNEKVNNLTLKHTNFSDFINEFEDEFFDLIVVDLGFSTNQLKFEQKGFSYQMPEQELDLRYNDEKGQSASKLINSISVDTLSKIIYDHSGETFARKIALKVGDYKQEKGDLRFVKDLIECVDLAIPDKFKNKRNQILARVWQSLRIEVNNEFEVLKKFLKKAPEKLKVGGQLSIVNFHSLEDKITTKTFRDLSKTFETDDYGNKGQYYELVTKKPITPDDIELINNPQSRSATLRILKRV